ncbi:DoxX family protein [Flavobacterium hydatis]|uniref:DoxX protein n=1 Tax=Flavobacterium hydatis TaxID=991 RepID=A0A085ZCS8_FLAHY|nr:DoxX family protein [Flavobacterium hydatis]KFF02242.1 DoxX protein [Flavobacterium hydatis]OXA86019.1 DoxX protein [Flavobacterium hydatis]
MKKHQDTATLLLRIALAIGFLSAVSSRLGLWGEYSSGWQNFIAYAEKVNSFAPKNSIPVIAILSTILETVFALMLLIGYKTRLAATGATFLTLLFALAMTYSFGIKDPLDYSVFAFSAAAFLLATMPQYRWSIDEILLKNKN